MYPFILNIIEHFEKSKKFDLLNNLSVEKKFEILNYLKDNGKKILFFNDENEIFEGLEFDDLYISNHKGNFRLSNVRLIDSETFKEIIDFDGSLILGDIIRKQ